VKARRYIEDPMARISLRARITRPYRRLRFASFGERSVLHRPDWVFGAHRIEIGRAVVVLGHAWLSADRRTWNEPGAAISIGDGTMIRSYCVISAVRRIEIESNVLVAAFCSILDSDHTITEADRNPLWNPLEAEPVRIGSGSWLGERVTVLRGSNIGRKCIIGAHSVVKGTIPDHSIAVGAPAVVVGSTLPSGTV
jgi:acetyltransferase-like isoleucine patch superfamily enzyme